MKLAAKSNRLASDQQQERRDAPLAVASNDKTKTTIGAFWVSGCEKCGSDAREECETGCSSERNMTPPAAPLVWDAIGISTFRAPSRAHYYSEDTGERSDTIHQNVEDWIVEHGRNDLGMVLEFENQLSGITVAAADVLRDDYDIATGGRSNCDSYTDFIDWLILQGEDLYDAVMETPSLVQLIAENYHECLSAVTSAALNRILTPCSGHDLLNTISVSMGRALWRMVPSDFAGWNAERVRTSYADLWETHRLDTTEALLRMSTFAL